MKAPGSAPSRRTSRRILSIWCPRLAIDRWQQAVACELDQPLHVIDLVAAGEDEAARERIGRLHPAPCNQRCTQEQCLAAKVGGQGAGGGEHGKQWRAVFHQFFSPKGKLSAKRHA